MSLNYKEIDLILKELNLTGSRIDKINQYDRFSLYLETYGPHKKQKIIISLTHSALRLNRTEVKPSFPGYPPRFAQLLRSRIKGGRIVSVTQPEDQRIIKFTIRSGENICHLWCRLWGGNPNMILTDENHQIIDTLFRKTSLQEIAGKIYNPDFSLLKSGNNKTREVRPFPSVGDFNSFIDHDYNQKSRTDDFERIKEKKIKNLDEKIKNLSFHKSKLENRQRNFSEWEKYRQIGEIIQANLYRLKKGDELLRTENYFNNNEMIEIPLKRELSPIENCESQFKRYKRSRQGLQFVKSEISIVEKSLVDLLSFRDELLKSVTLDDLNEQTSDQNKRSVVSKNKPQIGLVYHSHGYNIFVGRNSGENDKLLRNKVRGNDIWLHVRDFPGGYILIKSIKGKSVPLEVLLDGANLALLYSSKKYKDKADIHYTEVKNLRRVKGGKEGLVLANNEKNLFISYDENRIKRLQHKDNLLETILRKKDN